VKHVSKDNMCDMFPGGTKAFNAINGGQDPGTS
jgi:hypothetical protein